MGKITGFMEIDRSTEPYRKADERIKDFKEIYTDHNEIHLKNQGARCMDCGVPFCQSDDGCPIHNLIPEWNDLVYQHQWRDALDRLHETNNFPEFTGRVCPAPCEGACVLGITDPPVTIKNIEMAIVDRGFEEGWINPTFPKNRTNKKIAIVGSGPAGLAAADQLNKAGHNVSVFEREDRVGGLLMYGIPNMKLEKEEIVNRRIEIMKKSGINFITNANIGTSSKNGFNTDSILREYDALLLATGATTPRDLNIPGRDLKGVHFAMDYLTANTKKVLDSKVDNNYISAKGKNVIVIGGGDTGTDCIGTALRQGCKSLVNFELLPQPPQSRAASNPWPSWPKILRTEYGHEEAISKFGKDPRSYKLSSKQFLGDGKENLTGIITEEIQLVNGRIITLPGTEKKWKADLIFLAMGFLGPEHGLSDQLGITYDERSNYKANYGEYKTNINKIFAAGDCRRGQSLVVNAINEGREAAREIDIFLMGETQLP